MNDEHTIGMPSGRDMVVAFATIAMMSQWKLWLLLAKWILSLLVIKGDQVLRKHIPASIRINLRLSRFPTGSAEFLSAKQMFSEILSKQLLPKNALLCDVLQIGKLQAEPDKNQSSFGAKFVYTLPGTDGSKRYMNSFLKFQTGGDHPLWLQAIRWAEEGSIMREVDFYSTVSTHVPIRVPKVLFTAKTPLANSICLALEFIPIDGNVETLSHEKCGSGDLFRVIPDHKVETCEYVELMLTNIAKMHAKFLHSGKEDRHPAARWIPATKGLDFCNFVRTLGPKELVEHIAVFDAIDEYFTKKPVSVVHGDCRPGNMIFVYNKSKAEDKHRLTDVIFADWEAVNVAPPLWDFTYAVCIGVPKKKLELSKLLEIYRTSLVDTLGGRLAVVDSLEEMLDQVVLLQIVLMFYVYAVFAQDLWKGHGNTNEDNNTWRERYKAVFENIDTGRASELLSFDKSKLEDLKSMIVSWMEKDGWKAD